MAISACAECEKEIRAAAASCRHGKRSPTASTATRLVGGAFVLLTVVAICGALYRLDDRRDLVADREAREFRQRREILRRVFVGFETSTTAQAHDAAPASAPPADRIASGDE
jgi:hypothetical protein